MNEQVPAIDVQNVTRLFGNIEAVQNVSFSIPQGQVVGFIGANGAGKTTTMRMLATLDSPSSGRIRILGHDVQHFQATVRTFLGWMPDWYGTYENMTVFEYLDFYARAFSYSGIDRRRRIKEVMDFTDLNPLSERFTTTLSKGMGQRLCLGRMLLHDPKVLIMDEPAAGLDPKARVEFKHLIRILAGEGKTIFLSSHILSELEDMCDDILFIDSGRIVHHGSTESLKRGDDMKVVLLIEVVGDVTTLVEWIELQPGVALVETTKNGIRITATESSPVARASLLKRLISDGFNIVEFRREERKLEDAIVC